MRIGFVVHQFFPRHHTGTEQYVRALAREAIRRGDDARVLTHEPHLAATTPGRAVVDDDVEGIPVRRVAVARGVVANPVLADHVHPLHALLARRWLEEWRPQALHVFHLLGLGSSVLLEAADLGIPVVFHATDFWTVCPIATLTLPHGEACEGPPDGGLGCFGCLHRPVGERLDREQLVGEVQAIRDAAGALRLHRPLLGALAFGLVGRREELVARVSGARAVVAPSRFLLETLARHGFERDRLSLIPYGLDLARLEGLRERSAGPIAFGYFGTLAPHKGVHVLLEAFRAVPGDARLVVRGNPDDFPDYSARLRRLAEGDDRIALAPPFPPSGLGAALSEIDALVVPSLWHENTPFVALEALAARRPVLASDRGGLAEIVGDGRGGALFRAGDTAELTRALEAWSSRERLERARVGFLPPRRVAEAYDDVTRLLSA